MLTNAIRFMDVVAPEPSAEVFEPIKWYGGKNLRENEPRLPKFTFLVDRC